jgi:hypothetical protein
MSYQLRGRGFGFRGTSPPWPYIGRGRGGLPRCYYFIGTGMSLPSDYVPVIPKEQELAFLKQQEKYLSYQLKQLEKRIKELENQQ